MFPAGEVSTYRDGKLVVDKPWEEAAMKLVQRAEVPSCSYLFSCEKQSSLFYRAGQDE